MAVPGRHPNAKMTDGGSGTTITPDPMSSASLSSIAFTPLVGNCKLNTHVGQAIKTVGNQMTN
jgi:hypothetical protein